MIERTIEQYTEGDYVEDWDLDGMFVGLGQFFPVDIGAEELEGNVDHTLLTQRIIVSKLLQTRHFGCVIARAANNVITANKLIQNRWTVASAIDVPPFPFQNRPTFQQTVEVTKRLPR